MSGYTLTWDGVSSAVVSGIIIQKVRRSLIGAIRDTAVAIPGRDGSYLFPERRGDRMIRAEGVIVAAPDVRHAAVVQLADWFDKSGARALVVDDQPDRFWSASVASDPDPDEWKSTGKFVLEWRSEPYSLAVATSSDCSTATDGGSDSFVVPGGVDAEPVVEITPINGNITALQLIVSGDALDYVGTIAQGDTLTISGVTYTVTTGPNEDIELVGTYVPGTVFPGDVTGSFPFLEAGTVNWSITWDGTATQTRVCFHYRQRFH